MILGYTDPSPAESWFGNYVKDKILPKVLEDYQKEYKDRPANTWYNEGYMTTSYDKKSQETKLRYEINLSTEFTKLIQDTGRFAENFASDILIDIDSVKRELENRDEMLDEPFATMMAIRQSGVDGTGFYVANLQQHANSDHYRKIYIFFIIPTEGYENDRIGTRIITCMKDITNDYYSQATELQKYLRDQKK